MKILFGILVVLTVVASFIADYKWRQWIANHRTDEDLSAGTPTNHPTDEDLSAGTPTNHRRDRQ